MTAYADEYPDEDKSLDSPHTEGTKAANGISFEPGLVSQITRDLVEALEAQQNLMSPITPKQVEILQHFEREFAARFPTKVA